MPYIAPITWAVNQLVTETDLNNQIRDNISYLKVRADTPARSSYTLNQSADITTSSTTFIDVDAALVFTIDTLGNDVMIGFNLVVDATTTTQSSAYFDVTDNGVRIGGDDGLTMCSAVFGGGNSGSLRSVSYVGIYTPPAGTHIFKLQWKISGAACAIRAGAGTAGKDTHGSFWVREI